jgi:hypothetical protein
LDNSLASLKFDGVAAKPGRTFRAALDEDSVIVNELDEAWRRISVNLHIQVARF